jgi:hypothetical protein
MGEGAKLVLPMPGGSRLAVVEAYRLLPPL